ncbi:ABC1 family-domain-containing protein [Mycotypha africana]|uniref:ABC1 family-domain-containing protein n=1 Tax=Mycotypha africana TaxID=64632 RepID=UPI0023012A20|nr:ABC1 family-domain-containing protein [Mycotypha africana]KAI8969005.1 ABC1 family-domain-containing protein [Mycotypha africana]
MKQSQLLSRHCKVCVSRRLAINPVLSFTTRPCIQSHKTKAIYSIRHYTTTTIEKQLQQQPRKSLVRRIINGAAIITLATTATVGIGGAVLYESSDQFRHVANALKRCAVAGAVGVQVAYDYHKTLSKDYPDEKTLEEAKRACHQRCANRVLAGVQKLGGVYVKLGQHISVMQYLLPVEWCKTMSVLQDRCDPTPPEAIKQLFLTDFGQPIEKIFDEFDWVPIGVASLAQVHRARLSEFMLEQLKQQEEVSRSNSRLNYLDKNCIDEEDRWVAVKLQHPYLDEYCKLDMDTVSFILEIVKRVFPDFGFDWFAEEMRESVPKELDFVHETENSRRVEANFAEDLRNKTTSLVVPKVIWAKRRIMCMEFIHGSRVDDLEYMKQHNIDPKVVSAELTRIFSQMIFIHGFVHCDPHPGNVFIRPTKNPKHSKYNFDLVLLDHGLYRELSEDLRSNYAHLWTSLIKADEEGIRKYSYLVGGTDIYQLFACMLTGREWDVISQSDLNSVRQKDEVGRISDGAFTYLYEVTDILGKLPRPVLLLLKTNDLLRHVDEKLNTVADDRMTYVIMGSFCSKAVWLDTKKHILDKIRSSTGFSFALLKQLIHAWWQYKSLTYALWLYEFSQKWVEKLNNLLGKDMKDVKAIPAAI